MSCYYDVAVKANAVQAAEYFSKVVLQADIEAGVTAPAVIVPNTELAAAYQATKVAKHPV